MAAIPHNSQTTSTSTGTPATINAQKIAVSSPNIRDGLQRLTQTVTFKQGDSVQRIPMSSFAQLVQTSTGRHIILHSSQQTTNTGKYFYQNSIYFVIFSMIKVGEKFNYRWMMEYLLTFNGNLFYLLYNSIFFTKFILSYCVYTREKFFSLHKLFHEF